MTLSFVLLQQQPASGFGGFQFIFLGIIAFFSLLPAYIFKIMDKSFFKTDIYKVSFKNGLAVSALGLFFSAILISIFFYLTFVDKSDFEIVNSLDQNKVLFLFIFILLTTLSYSLSGKLIWKFQIKKAIIIIIPYILLISFIFTILILRVSIPKHL